MTTATHPPADEPLTASTTDGAGDSFETAFAEFAGSPSGAVSDGAAPSERSDATGGERTDGAPPPGEAEGGAAPAQVQTQGGGHIANGDDIWNSASEQQRAAFEAAQAKLHALDHDSRSNRGRVAALQRETETLRKQLAALHGAAGSTGQDQTDASDADIRRLQEEYPEVARPVLKQISSLQRQLNEAQQRLDRRESLETQREREQALDREEQALAQMHPDWDKVTARPEFTAWLSTQPRYVVEAIQRNGEAIQDAAEAGDIITRFKQATGIAQATAAASAPAAVTATGASANLAARRQRQLESGATITSRGAGPAGGPPDDFEAAFAYYANKGR
ncbi:hypothetical protein D3877_11965 [Azospirillum cavernae]|uniref:Uncharacterized protein n=1 Tax=Azospirillum cavernae TaxID=2320860 RepID=A0A418VUZ7_9PROT|nr:hypothetical protein [Azospirillum cavernae]RJF80944.1 hypothetical protein D3877_11965 [Azospirillum cavernae]